MNKLFSIFLIGLCLFAAFVPTAFADDGEDEADSHDRDVQFETEDANKIEIASFDNVLGNEIKFRAETTSDGLYIEVEFHSEPTDSEDSSSTAKDGGSDGSSDGSSDSGSDGSDSENDFEVKFRAVFESLVSYVESNGIAGYQSDETATVTDLATINWDAFSCASSTDANGTNVISCTAQTSDLSFGIVAHIVDQPTAVSGVDVNPTGIKIDVYFSKTSSDYLAVVVGFASDSDDNSQDGDIEVDDGSDKQTSGEGSVNFADFGFFSWVTTATINGNTVNVVNSNATSNSNNGLDEVVYSFETSETGNLYWDPVLAVKGTSALSSDAMTMLPSLFVLAALAFLAL